MFDGIYEDGDAIQVPSYVTQKEDLYVMSQELQDLLNKQIHTINDPSDPRYGEYDVRWDSRDRTYGTQQVPEVTVSAPLTWKAHNVLGGQRGQGYVNRAQNRFAQRTMPIMMTLLGGAPFGIEGLLGGIAGHVGSEVGANAGDMMDKARADGDHYMSTIGGLLGGFAGGAFGVSAGRTPGVNIGGFNSNDLNWRDFTSGRYSGAREKALAKELDKAIASTTISTSPTRLNVGWGPRTRFMGSWAHTQPNERLSTNLPDGKIRWDADGRGMPITGGWVTEGRPGGMMAERPYIDWYEVTLNKPMTQVGEIAANGKNTTRSQLVRDAETLGADGFQFKGIADNRAKNQNVTYLYDPDSSTKPFGYMPPRIQESIQSGGNFQIKSLMSGNALERQLSKEGTISVNSVRAHANKASKIEQEAINWVLDNKFNGQKRINYAQLKQEVSNVLPKFEKRRVTEWETYGLDRIGYDVQEIPDGAGGIVYVASDKPTMNVRLQLLKDDELPLGLADNKAFNERFERVPWQQREDFYARMFGLDRGNNDSNFKYAYWDKLNNTYADTKDVLSWINDQGLNPSNRRVANNSYSYSNPIVGTNDKHYNNTTAHTRTFHLPDQDPNTLYVLEAQSDWAQNFTDELKQWQRTFDSRQAQANNVHHGEGYLPALPDQVEIELPFDAYDNVGLTEDFNKPGLWENKSWVNGDYPLDYRPEATNMQNYLKDNMQRLLLQQNLKHAKENNFTRMRYPTPDTAAKIEGYPKDTYTADQLADYVVGMEPENYIEPEMRNSPDEFYLAGDLDTFNKMVADSEAWDKTPTGQRFNKLWQKLKTMSDDDIHTQYRPEHETILNKYAEFPKMYEKLYGKGAVREVTDHKGNTWYEVDVPEQLGELQFEIGTQGTTQPQNFAAKVRRADPYFNAQQPADRDHFIYGDMTEHGTRNATPYQIAWGDELIRRAENEGFLMKGSPKAQQVQSVARKPINIIEGKDDGFPMGWHETMTGEDYANVAKIDNPHSLNNTQLHETLMHGTESIMEGSELGHKAYQTVVDKLKQSGLAEHAGSLQYSELRTTLAEVNQNIYKAIAKNQRVKIQSRADLDKLRPLYEKVIDKLDQKELADMLKVNGYGDDYAKLVEQDSQVADMIKTLLKRGFMLTGAAYLGSVGLDSKKKGGVLKRCKKRI